MARKLSNSTVPESKKVRDVNLGEIPRIRPTLGTFRSNGGGFELGAIRAGFEVKWTTLFRSVENLEKLGSPENNDLIRAGDQGGIHSYPKVDVVYVNGKNHEPENETIHTESIVALARRIIRVLGPRAIVLERMAGVVDSGLGSILRAIAEVGYDAEWATFSYEEFGLPLRSGLLCVVGFPRGPIIGKEAAIFRPDVIAREAATQRERAESESRIYATFESDKAVARRVPESFLRGMDDGFPDRFLQRNAEDNQIKEFALITGATPPSISEVVSRLVSNFLG